MDLQSYQRSLRRLVIGGQPAPDDPPYAQELAGSQRLEVVREVIGFWRSHALERYCVLSAAWLKRCCRFDGEIRRFIAAGEFSPDVALAGQQFLRQLAGDADAVVQALARFEIALHETRHDRAESRTVDWPCDPGPVLGCILGGSAPMPDSTSQPHRVTVSRALPGGYACEPLPADTTAAAAWRPSTASGSRDTTPAAPGWERDAQPDRAGDAFPIPRSGTMSPSASA